MAILRQQIIDTLLARMGEIRIQNGYHTDCGMHVYEWKPTKFDAHDLPGMNIKDPTQIDDDTITEDESLCQHDLTVIIEALCSNEHESPEEIRKMIADVEKVLEADLTLGGLAENIHSQGNELGVAQDEKIVAGATMTITVRYVTEKFNEE